ncbi:MAG: Flp pilus assembly complex ATPase component TadA, partial [Pandoraea sp.]|nr:Flp pilus assembly complex ATPase component TadA [Pandoraea sp.]
GMILVCGPTGSGKSTTLYTTLDTVARPVLATRTKRACEGSREGLMRSAPVRVACDAQPAAHRGRRSHGGKEWRHRYRAI